MPSGKSWLAKPKEAGESPLKPRTGPVLVAARADLLSGQLWVGDFRPAPCRPKGETLEKAREARESRRNHELKSRSFRLFPSPFPRACRLASMARAENPRPAGSDIDHLGGLATDKPKRGERGQHALGEELACKA